MADMAALFDQLVDVANKNAAEFDDSKQKAVKAFIKHSKELTPPETSRKRGRQEVGKGSFQHSKGGRRACKAAPKKAMRQAVSARSDGRDRVDCRSEPFVSVDVQNVPRGTNIYANSRYHVDAAMTLAAAANRASGWGADVDDSKSKAAFQALLQQLLGAPHWFLDRSVKREVQHHSSNHKQFTEDLMSIVTDIISIVKGGERAIESASKSVKNLADRLSSNVVDSINETLYSVVGIFRECPSAPVFYSIFFLNLRMRHNKNCKSAVLSSSTTAFAYVLRLDSTLLMRFADMYNRFDKRGVEEWLKENRLQ